MRAQAGVLKRAVLDEQNKCATLRESLRVKEIDLRRVEQEIDSLGFRNKQLEHRVASLQDDLSKDSAKKQPKGLKLKLKSDSSPSHSSQTCSSADATLLSEELQKKIIECAQLTSTVADKVSEIAMQNTRIGELEQLIRTISGERVITENTMRKEIERLETKNHELETKLTEASSIVGSDDTLYVSECEQHHKHIGPPTANSIGSSDDASSTNGTKNDERIQQLEKENAYWRTQYEILQLTVERREKTNDFVDSNKTIDLSKTINESTNGTVNADELIRKHYTRKIEDLFRMKCTAESKLSTYVDEVESLQRHLDTLERKLNDQQRKIHESQRTLRMTDEDLVRFDDLIFK